MMDWRHTLKKTRRIAASGHGNKPNPAGPPITSFRYNIDGMLRNLALVYINQPVLKVLVLYVVALKVSELINDVQ